MCGVRYSEHVPIVVHKLFKAGWKRNFTHFSIKLYSHWCLSKQIHCQTDPHVARKLRSIPKPSQRSAKFESTARFENKQSP
jgi:hypothetical protein